MRRRGRITSESCLIHYTSLCWHMLSASWLVNGRLPAVTLSMGVIQAHCFLLTHGLAFLLMSRDTLRIVGRWRIGTAHGHHWLQAQPFLFFFPYSWGGGNQQLFCIAFRHNLNNHSVASSTNNLFCLSFNFFPLCRPVG